MCCYEYTNENKLVYSWQQNKIKNYENIRSKKRIGYCRKCAV
jgi:hypothetical protein